MRTGLRLREARCEARVAAPDNPSLKCVGALRCPNKTKAPEDKRDVLNGQITLSYDCPCGQAMSYEMLRIVMIGFAKFKN